MPSTAVSALEQPAASVAQLYEPKDCLKFRPNVERGQCFRGGCDDRKALCGVSSRLGNVTSLKLPSAEQFTIHNSRPSPHQSVDKADPRSSLQDG
jgi:hypothetical protein